ncbi:hypothetical protein TNCV_3351811 [Trichonephila clavipes]|nr:hypothetical protein TNCV_3351811 [Trichonephila clavipes]
MEVCKCILPLRHQGTLNSRRGASRPLRLVKAKERLERPFTTPRVFTLKVEEETSEILLSLAWCSKLRLTTGVQPRPCHEEFHGPRSGTDYQVALATTIVVIRVIDDELLRVLVQNQCVCPFQALKPHKEWCSISVYAPQQKRKRNKRNNFGCSFAEAEKSPSNFSMESQRVLRQSMSFCLRQPFNLRNEQNMEKTPAGFDCPAVSAAEFVAVNDENECTKPIKADKDNFGMYSKLQKYH